jgi:hypothetical protein
MSLICFFKLGRMHFFLHFWRHFYYTTPASCNISPQFFAYKNLDGYSIKPFKFKDNPLSISGDILRQSPLKIAGYILVHHDHNFWVDWVWDKVTVISSIFFIDLLVHPYQSTTHRSRTRIQFLRTKIIVSLQYLLNVSVEILIT